MREINSLLARLNVLKRILSFNKKDSIHKQMLERMRRRGNPSALLVGMQTGEATVENSMEFPQKTKNGTAL